MPKKLDSDLEDGEIRDDYEAISDCSLSEIVTMKQSLEEDIDVLREEALKAMYEEEEEENEVLEEERYRLEALKSLLFNMELEEDQCENTEPDLKPKQKPKKKKRRPLDLKSKRKKRGNCETLRQSEDTESYVFSTKSSFCASSNNKKTDPESLDFRNWYPKTDFLLTCVPDTLETVMESESNFPTTPKLSTPKSNKSYKTVVQVVPNPLTEIKVTNTNKKKNIQLPSRIYKKVLNNVPKINSTTPMNNNKFTSSTIRNGKYKLVNKSRFSLRKTEPKVTRDPIRSNNTSKSKYSINRIQYPTVEIDPNEFIIELDEDESSKEDEKKTNQERTMPNTTTEKDIRDVKNCDKKEKYSNVTVHLENYPCTVQVKQEPYVEVSGENSGLEENLGSSEKTFTGSEQIKTEHSQDVKAKMTNGKVNRINGPILVEAEKNLLSIRQKLLNDLDELEGTMKRNAFETEKLNELLKKFLALKSYVLKFEEKVKLQQCRVTKNVTYMNSLFCGIKMRSQNCSKFKEICCHAGKQLVGPSYKPPDKFENQIIEKQKEIDHSKYKSTCM